MPRRNTEVEPATPTPRLVGIDVARALAIIGMFASHTLSLSEFDIDAPSTWVTLTQGHSAATFVMLAGLSVALFSGGTRRPSDTELVHTRHTLLVRAVLIFALGALLQMLGTPIVIILIVYAFFFVAALPLLRTAPHRLFLAAAVIAVVMPVVMPLIDAVFRQWGAPVGSLYGILIDGGFPALTWSCYFLIGMGLGRLDLSSRRVVEQVASWGIALAAGAYLAAAALSPLRSALDPHDDAPAPGSLWAQSVVTPDGTFGWSTDNLVALLGAGPYSSTPFNLIGSAGISLLVIAFCLLLFPTPTRWNAPLRATGRLALTNYSAHIVALFALYHLMPADEEENVAWMGVGTWAAFTVAAILGSTLWLRYHERGPLEGMIADISARSAGPRPERMR